MTSFLVNDRQVLIDELESMGIQSNSYVTIEDFFEKIQLKVKIVQLKKFDQDVGAQLAAKMEPDQLRRVSTQKIIEVLQEAAKILARKSFEARTCLEQYTLQREKALIKYHEQAAIERKNQFNIMEGSLLHIKPIECMIEGERFLNVIAQCGTIKECLSWKKVSQFPIVSGSEDLVICMESKEKREIVCVCYLTLEGLRDQRVTTRWLQMDAYPGCNSCICGRLKVELHWIHSTALFLREIIADWEKQINDVSKELEDYSIDISILTQPFPSLKATIQKETQKQIQIQVGGTKQPLFEGQQSEQQTPIPQEQQISDHDPNNTQLSLLFSGKNKNNNNSKDMSRFLVYSCFAYLGLALVLSIFQRTLFFDIVLGLIFIVDMERRILPSRWKHFVCAMLTSVAFEITSIIIFIITYLKEKETTKMDKAQICLSLCFLILKVEMLGLFLFMSSSENKESFLNSSAKDKLSLSKQLSRELQNNQSKGEQKSKHKPSFSEEQYLSQFQSIPINIPDPRLSVVVDTYPAEFQHSLSLKDKQFQEINQTDK